MKRMINLTNSPDDLNRFSGVEDLENFYKTYGCDGYEYMALPGEEQKALPKEMVTGLHLSSYNAWMDFWREDEEALLREYGNWENVSKVFGGRKREILVSRLQKELDLAQELKAEYVVFHVSEVKIKESVTYEFDYQDEEVIRAAAQWINEAMEGREYDFYFLMENLWWPGFSFTSPSMTRLLLELVNYPKKGIMLDTGHLLHTELELKDQREAADYVLKRLEEHGELCRFIKGVHLNQSLTGQVVKEMRSREILWKEDYYDRWCQIFDYIFQIDLHQPFTHEKVREILEAVQPEYVTMELISRSRKEHEQMLALQTACLDGKAPSG